jgi:hypothetical protein
VHLRDRVERRIYGGIETLGRRDLDERPQQRSRPAQRQFVI